MSLLVLLLRKSAGAVALAVLCGLLSGASSAGLIAQINELLASGGALVDSRRVLGFAGIGMLMLGSRIGSQLLMNRLQTRSTFDLRAQLSNQILATPLRRLEELGTHRLLATLVDDIRSLTQSLLCVPVILLNTCIVLGCLGYLAMLSRVVFAALLVFAALGVTSYWVPTLRMMRTQRMARETNDRLFRDFRSLTGGLKELMLHRERREAFLTRELLPTAAELRELQMQLLMRHTLLTSWGMSLFFLFIGLMLFALPGIAPVSSQAMVGYTLAALYLQQPLDSIMTLLPTMGQGAIALRHIEQLALGEAGAGGAPGQTGPLAPPASISRLELSGVTHTYLRDGEGTRFTLGPIDLAIHPGEILFVVGGNGSGKTTLAKLITGLYAPESGEVRLDGKPVLEGDRERYRQLFATVFSDFHLFEALLGLASADLAGRARGYLERLQLAHKVEIDASGALSTTQLSTGQRKRLALLTAYLENRPVYLFDEWAADQDPAFKEVFYRELLPDLKAAGKAVVVISHDDRYFDVADRLVRLESGALVPDESAPARNRAVS